MKRLLILCLVFSLTLSVFSFAITGQEVMNKVKAANSNFKTQKAEMEMIIYGENSQPKDYHLVIYVYNFSNKDYGLIRFTSPVNVKGISFLSKGEESQYLYMPAFHRVQRMAGSSKESKFVGSNFTFNDLSLIYEQKESGKYKTILESESKNDYVVNVIPTISNPQYSKIVMVIDKAYLLPSKITFYKSGKVYKVMTSSGFEKINGHWVVKNIQMTVPNGVSKTVLKLSNIKFNLPIPSSFFSLRTLMSPVLRY